MFILSTKFPTNIVLSIEVVDQLAPLGPGRHAVVDQRFHLGEPQPVHVLASLPHVQDQVLAVVRHFATAEKMEFVYSMISINFTSINIF